MQIVKNILLLLIKKQELFLEFERYTNLLAVCDVEDMDNYITKRADLANEIDNVTDQISNLAKTVTVTPSIDMILSNSCCFSEVPSQWQEIFLEAQKIKGIVSRCIEVNLHALERMTELRDNLKELIAQNNNTPRIIKYISTSGALQQENSINITNTQI
ncbi:hypothetical protein ACS3UN_01435 [Oscillospiraceae bacterium LTW-04]|nr:hypothetical protein RBH76_09025 [Oscillospiraceae bacterium MB24-C1]